MNDPVADLLHDGIREVFETEGVKVEAILVMVREGDGYGLRAFTEKPGTLSRLTQEMALGILPPWAMFNG